MWINAQGGLYFGDCAAGDRTATQAEIDAWKNARTVALAALDPSDMTNLPRTLRAAMLVMALWNGKTVAQAKAAFKTAWDSLA